MKVAAGAAKEAELDGARLPSPSLCAASFPAIVFTPDRLAVVKGGSCGTTRVLRPRARPAATRRRPALPQDYAAALAQRNAALRRVQLGLSDRDALAPWTERVASIGAQLVGARQRAIAALSPGFAACAEELGLAGADARL